MLQPLQAPEVNAGAQSSSIYGESASGFMNLAAAAASVECQSALMDGPAASLVALTKHQASIAPRLANALEEVGSYSINEVAFPGNPYAPPADPPPRLIRATELFSNAISPQ